MFLPLGRIGVIGVPKIRPQSIGRTLKRYDVSGNWLGIYNTWVWSTMQYDISSEVWDSCKPISNDSNVLSKVKGTSYKFCKKVSTIMSNSKKKIKWRITRARLFPHNNWRRIIFNKEKMYTINSVSHILNVGLHKQTCNVCQEVIPRSCN